MVCNYKKNIVNYIYIYLHLIIFGISRKGQKYPSPAKALKRSWLQRVKDASMHFAARALPRLARPHRCIAHNPRTAVHGCSRVIMQVLLLVASARPWPQTDVECWLSPVLTPSALAFRRDPCTRLVATLHRWTAESIISHWMWFPTYMTKRDYRFILSLDRASLSRYVLINLSSVSTTYRSALWSFITTFYFAFKIKHYFFIICVKYYFVTFYLVTIIILNLLQSL